MTQMTGYMKTLSQMTSVKHGHFKWINKGVLQTKKVFFFQLTIQCPMGNEILIYSFEMIPNFVRKIKSGRTKPSECF